MLYFWKVVYHLKISGWTSGFRAIDHLPRAYWDETGFRLSEKHTQTQNELLRETRRAIVKTKKVSLRFIFQNSFALKPNGLYVILISLKFLDCWAACPVAIKHCWNGL